MTRTLMILGLVATLFVAVGGPSLSATPASASEQTTSNYCESIPESLIKQGFAPGICR